MTWVFSFKLQDFINPSSKKHDSVICSSQENTLTVFDAIQFLPRTVGGKVGSTGYNSLVFVSVCLHSLTTTGPLIGTWLYDLSLQNILCKLLSKVWAQNSSLPGTESLVLPLQTDSWPLLYYVSTNGHSTQLPGAGCTLLYVSNGKILLVSLSNCFHWIFLYVQILKWVKWKKKRGYVTWKSHQE